MGLTVSSVEFKVLWSLQVCEISRIPNSSHTSHKTKHIQNTEVYTSTNAQLLETIMDYTLQACGIIVNNKYYVILCTIRE